MVDIPPNYYYDCILAYPERYHKSLDAFCVQDEYPEEQFAGFVGIVTSCRNCNKSFASGNNLHKHLRDNCSTGSTIHRDLNANASKHKNENVDEHA